MNSKLETTLEELWKRSRFTSYFFQSVQFSEENSIPTLALTIYTSRLTLFYNSDFIEQTGSEELIGLLVHEMLHIILSHNHRAFPGDDIFLQNLAQDMVINSYILDMEELFFSGKNRYGNEIPLLVIPWGLPMIPMKFHRQTGIQDPSWEEVYRWLKNLPPEDLPKFKGDLSDSDSDAEDSENKFSSDESSPNADEAAAASPDSEPREPKDRSAPPMDGLSFTDNNDNPLPAGMHLFHNPRLDQDLDSVKERFLNFALRDDSVKEERPFQEISALIERVRQVDTSSWRHMIKSLVDYSSQSKDWIYTYGRFNRRYFTQGIYAPGRIFQEKEALTVVVDVSASMVMTPGELEAAFGVVEDLMSKYIVHLLCIDENVFVPEKKDNRFVAAPSSGAASYVYKKGDWKFIKSGTSGTTFFASLFNKHMKNHREMLIIITDGFIYDIDQLRKYSPTLWVISGNRPDPFAAPFGRVVEIKEKKV
ncbi:MAG: hypothetical protein GY754_39835 [bacterium]|nr:hypothetical protein [bacterium]